MQLVPVHLSTPFLCLHSNFHNQNQNQNSLLVKRQTDNTTPGEMGLDRRGLVPSSH